MILRGQTVFRPWRRLTAARRCCPLIILLGCWLLANLSATAQVFTIPAPGIGFSNLSGNTGDPYTGSSEGPFAVTPTAGSWFQSQIYGNPGASIYDGPAGAPGPGVLQITDGAGLFTLSSFSFSSNNGDSQYDIRGFLGSTLKYDERGTLPGTFGPFNFSTLAISNSTVQIDGLFIAVTPGFGATSVNVDSIAVATVPEPANLLVLGLAYSTLRMWRRSRR